MKKKGFKVQKKTPSTQDSGDIPDSTTENMPHVFEAEPKIKEEPIDVVSEHEDDVPVADPELEPFLPCDQSELCEVKENVSEVQHITESAHTKKDKPKLKPKGKPIRSLTDEEYEEIFAAALSRCDTSDTGPSETAEQSGTSQKVKTIQDHTLAEVDELDRHFHDMDLDKLPEHIKTEIEQFPEENSVIGEASYCLNKPKVPPPKAKSFSVSNKKKRPAFGTAARKTEEKTSHKKDMQPKKQKPEKPLRDRKLKMQQREIDETGTWVQCTDRSCMKWRYLPDIHDPALLPDVWTCEMNSDVLYNSCDLPEEEFNQTEHNQNYIFTRYTEGSIVWARMAGYPWWPAMVEIDPDYESYFDCRMMPNVASHYHVVFFDDQVSRAWIGAGNVLPFSGHQTEKHLGLDRVKNASMKKGLSSARKSAEEASQMTLKDRILIYSFAERYKGRWGKDGGTVPTKKEKSVARRKSNSNSKDKPRKRKQSKSRQRTDRETETDLELLSSQDLSIGAEAIMKDAEEMLTELFSSQADDDKSVKESQKNVFAKCTTSLDPDVFTMQLESEDDNYDPPAPKVARGTHKKQAGKRKKHKDEQGKQKENKSKQFKNPINRKAGGAETKPDSSQGGVASEAADSTSQLDERERSLDEEKTEDSPMAAEAEEEENKVTSPTTRSMSKLVENLIKPSKSKSDRPPKVTSPKQVTVKKRPAFAAPVVNKAKSSANPKKAKLVSPSPKANSRSQENKSQDLFESDDLDLDLEIESDVKGKTDVDIDELDLDFDLSQSQEETTKKAKKKDAKSKDKKVIGQEE